MSRKILFISHDASRTGAPILLLHFLKWLRLNSDYPFMVLLKKDGELKTKFEELSDVFVFTPKSHKWIEILRNFANHYRCPFPLDRFHRMRIKRLIKKQDIGLIYSNTGTNGNILHFFSDLRCPVISHIHELDWAIHYYGLKGFNYVKQYTNNYIAASNAVKKNLITNHYIPEKLIEVEYEFIDNLFNTVKSSDYIKDKILNDLKIPKNGFVVCSSGTIDWRKGTDLFVQLAGKLRKNYPEQEIFFIWVGGEKTGQFFDQISYDAVKLKLEPYLKFVENKSNPLPYFSICHVFAMISREDPFPLVCLEAASIGKPIVCFDQAGGIQEFVKKDAGFVVSYLDIDEMADRIIELKNNEILRSKLGHQASYIVNNNYNVNSIAPNILKIIEKTKS